MVRKEPDMARLAICPQRHVWCPSSAGALVCPLCGEQGTPAAIQPTGTNLDAATLPPTVIPPIVDDVTLCPPAAVLAGLPDGDEPEIPGYDIVRELGRGGMGVVYAARHRDLKRLVALKMIHAGGQHDPEMRERFVREATAVARLQHPGIVQIHDLGEHGGRPYLALEFVEANNLADQVEGKPIGSRPAAALIAALARAVHYAHQQGVVHRDLTPRNVLLARSDAADAIHLGDGTAERFVPRLTDFGLARQLDTEGDRTQTGVIMGTPNYMSPEQAQGRQAEIGPATDVHALGTILYELLTGRPPFLGETRLDTLRQVVEDEPVAPTRLQARIPRDLETICLKCLAKTPADRYTSAADLAADLERFLGNQPVLARPSPARERAVKWARRRPAAAALVGVAALAVVSLSVLGLVYCVHVNRERERAEENTELALRAIDEMLSQVGAHHLYEAPQTEQVRRRILERALELSNNLMRQNEHNPRLRFATAESHRRMGDILRLLDRQPQAIDAYQAAIAGYEDPATPRPPGAASERQRAYCLNFLGESLRASGRHAEAESAYLRAEELRARVARAFPENPRWRKDLAQTVYNLGILYREMQQPAKARAALDRSIGLVSELVEEFPDDREYRHHLARALLNLGTVARAAGDAQGARAASDRALALYQSLLEDEPRHPDYRYELAVVCGNAGNVHAQLDELELAQGLYDQARPALTSLVADFPHVPAYRQELANLANSAGALAADRNDPAQAAAFWREADALLTELVREHPDSGVYQGDLGMVDGNLGLAAFDEKNLDLARAHFERAIGHAQAAVEAGHPAYRETLRDNCQNLAETLLTLGQATAAADAARRLAAFDPQSPRERYVVACFLARCAAAVHNDVNLPEGNRQSQADAYCSEALDHLRAALDHGFHDSDQFRRDRAGTLGALEEQPGFREVAERLAAAGT